MCSSALALLHDSCPARSALLLALPSICSGTIFLTVRASFLLLLQMGSVPGPAHGGGAVSAEKTLSAPPGGHSQCGAVPWTSSARACPWIDTH